MKSIAWLWLLMWLSAFITIGLTAGCVPVEPVAVAKIDPVCPKGLTHDECVQFKFFTKYPGMLPRK